MSSVAQELLERIENLGDEPTTAWKPKPGETLVGELLTIDVRSTD